MRGTAFPALGPDCAGFGLSPGGRGAASSLLQSGRSAQADPAAPAPSPHTKRLTLLAATAQQTPLCPEFKRSAAGVARAAIGRFEKESARSSCPVHPGRCSSSAREKTRRARAHCLHARVGCACPKSARCWSWARGAGRGLLRTRAACTCR